MIYELTKELNGIMLKPDSARITCLSIEGNKSNLQWEGFALCVRS